MKNPFSFILDQYAEGAEKAYHQLLRNSQLELPSVTSGLAVVKQKLHKYAFAFLAMDYTVKVARAYAFEDFQYFIDELYPDRLKPEIYYLMGQAGIPWEEDLAGDRDTAEAERFREMLWHLMMVSYRKEWAALLFKAFNHETGIQGFFQKTILEGQALSFA